MSDEELTKEDKYDVSCETFNSNNFNWIERASAGFFIGGVFGAVMGEILSLIFKVGNSSNIDLTTFVIITGLTGSILGVFFTDG